MHDFTLDNDKTTISIKRIQMFAPKEEGLYVAFSGGKDSIVLLDLVRRANVKHDVHFNITSVDPPELIKFIREHYPEVTLHGPPKNMWKLMLERMMPPTRLVRYCCQELKERGGIGRTIIATGIRWEESNKRRNRRMIEVCLKDKTKHYLNPIIDWTVGEIWNHIISNKLICPSLYDEGFKRIGCVGCPMAGKNWREKEFARWPRIKDAWRRSFDKMWLEREKKISSGILDPGNSRTRFYSSEEWWQWWINDKKRSVDDSQMVIFE